ncbi:TadE/TadG family type IV pilus assembly protein [Sulfitobacter sp. PS-8MA]|uniref:TadE/TadG family type IV pilus assembly protein n=1 Tax=Sulfitobacter sp. PS-8MA TaxID=3237707 RepID=UPI0034C65C32
MKSFKASESGAVTIEFAILLPVVLYLFFMAIESGLWSAREIMLRRATNMVARDVRLSVADPPDYNEMKSMICEKSFFNTGCMDSIRIQMQAMPISEWGKISDVAPCVDREEDFDPANTFMPGQQNELMMVRVCRLFNPILPGTGLGRKLPENSDGEYGVRITTAFVTEPRG